MKGQVNTMLIIAGVVIALSGLYVYSLGSVLTVTNGTLNVNGSLTVNGSDVCTATNGICASGSRLPYDSFAFDISKTVNSTVTWDLSGYINDTFLMDISGELVTF